MERGKSTEGRADLSAYEEVILMDWESDGIIGTTPVRLDLNFTTCPTGSTCTYPSQHQHCTTKDQQPIS